MPHYLYQVAYTPEAWAKLVEKPQNRIDAVRPVIERLGGKVENFWMAFGEYDVVGLCEMPNNVNAAAFSIAASAGGAVKSFRTTPLLEIEEGIDAMRRASDRGYTPPKS